MSNELVIKTRDQLAAMPVSDLKKELGRAIRLTAEAIEYLAAVWAELERRGEDLSDIRTGLTAYLPRIAQGELSARVMIELLGNRTALDRIAHIPPQEQEEMLATPVQYLEKDATGELVQKSGLVPELTPAQIRLAIDENGKPIPLEEQKERLRKKVTPKAMTPQIALTEDEQILIGGKLVDRDYLIRQLIRLGVIK